MKQCNWFCAAECVNGYCPKARREEREERGMDVINNCQDCWYDTGKCEDCIFEGETGVCAIERRLKDNGDL